MIDSFHLYDRLKRRIFTGEDFMGRVKDNKAEDVTNDLF